MRTKRRIFVAALGLFLGAQVARADIIVGTYNAAGSLTVTGVPGVFTLTPTGALIGVPTLNGIFAAIAPGTAGVNAPITLGVGAFSISPFITMAGFTFSLTSVAGSPFSSAACGAPAAAGQNCGFPTSGLSFTNLPASQSSMSYSFAGSVTTPGAQSFSYTGVFSSQFSVPYQTLLAQLAAGAPLPVSYSLTINASIPDAVVTPEPATLGLVATGLLAIAGFVRRRRSALA